jgi:predicted metal-dependent enzyme (double-stranded beta helix superfamily)
LYGVLEHASAQCLDSLKRYTETTADLTAGTHLFRVAKMRRSMPLLPSRFRLMPLPPLSPKDLHNYCAEWSEPLGQLTDIDSKIAYVRKRLPALLENRLLITAVLNDIKKNSGEPRRRRHMLFDNEWCLHMDAKRRFSVRMYLYRPEELTVVHDHSSWGVLGCASGEMEIVKYSRKDDGQKNGYALLEETERITCTPGRTDTTLPLDEGIHRVGNPTDRTIVVINVYGTPLRRLYINCFDIENNRVTKIFPPRLKKKMPA